MPEVGGKKYPYTKAGIKAAATAREKLESDDSFRLSPPKSSENLQASLQKVVKNPAPHRPRTDNAVPRSSNPQPTGTSIDGSSGAMGGEGGVKPRGPKKATIKSLQKFWQDDIDIWKANGSPEEDTSVAPIRSVAPNRRRREAEILREGRRQLREETADLPPLTAARVRREAAPQYRKQRFGGRPGHRARHGSLNIGGMDIESTERKTVRPGAKRISDDVSVQGPEREEVNTGMGKRGSDVPTRSVEHSTRRMVSSGRALAGDARDAIASGRTIAAKDPKTTVLKPEDYTVKMMKALGIRKAPTSEENARKLNNEVLEQEKREREEIQSGTEQEMRDAGMPEDEITRQRPGVRLSSRVSAPSNMYTSDEAYRSDPDFEAASGGTEFGRDRLSNVIRSAGKKSAIEHEKYKYGDWDKPGESTIQNLYKAFGLMKDHLPIPPRQGEVWDAVKHRWVKPENAGRTVAEVQGEKRFRGSGVGAHERGISAKTPFTSRRFFARGTKGVVSRRGTPSKRTARATRGPRTRRKA
jgi:hypothetical protein